MIDFASHSKYTGVGQCLGDIKLTINSPECQCELCKGNEDFKKALRTDYDSATGAPEESWKEEQLMLCPPRFLRYILQEKLWAQFLVDGIEEIDEDDSPNAFDDRLMLPEELSSDRKAILMGLVKSHYAAYCDNLHQLEDIVPGKGNGLIILLYGNFRH